MKPDNFINIPFTIKNLDLYVVKTILNAIKENLPKLYGQLLDVGWGKMPYRKYIIDHSEVKNYVGLDLENCGFKQIEIKASGGWNASLAQMLGLWVNRSPISKRRKKLFTRIIKTVIHYLLKRDEIPVQFNSSQMITTIYGTALKK